MGTEWIIGISLWLVNIEWGDAATWATAAVAVLALIVACCSAVLSWKSLRWEQLSAESSARSASAAERANLLAERAVAAGFQRLTSPGQPQSPPASADEEVQRPTAGVSWRIEHPGGNRYVLRNIGSDIAEHVYVDEVEGPVTRNLPKDAVIRPGEGADILMLGTWGGSVPNQLYVRWEGQPDWVAVPIR